MRLCCYFHNVSYQDVVNSWILNIGHLLEVWHFLTIKQRPMWLMLSWQKLSSMLISISVFNAVALGEGPLAGLWRALPHLSWESFLLFSVFSDLKVNCYENKRPPRWPNMADHVLSILTSKLCTATALRSKLMLRFYNNEEHKGNLFTPPGE